MPFIDLPEAPGLLSLLRRYPDTARPLADLAQVLLRGPSSLTAAEREVLATYVSDRNACSFCAETHGATAEALLGPDAHVVSQVREAGPEAPVDGRLRALLAIAGKVCASGRAVTAEDVQRAREEGADDQAIHDTVLVAAAFCMFDRYVDGLATQTPTDAASYRAFGADLAANGYRLSQT